MPKKDNSEVTYTCQSCNGEAVDFETIKHHMEEVHKLDLTTQKFSQQMTSHMDGRDWYGSVYRMTAQDTEPPVIVIKSATYKRSKKDAMYWG